MNREDLLGLIQKEIQAVAFEYLKEKTQKEKAKVTDDYMNSRSINDEELDHALFHGGRAPSEEKIKNKIALKEFVDPILKITTSEIKEFENSFRDIIQDIPGATIEFDKQKNGYSLTATKKADGVEAKASGVLNLGGNGKIIWSYSIEDGFKVNAQNLKLDQSNKMLVEKLVDHFSDWDKKWRNNLNLPNSSENGQENTEESQSESNPSTPGQSMPPVSGGGPGQMPTA